ncbi:MAG: MFS transporter, partial [Nocardia sp.]|nr:MFS transporter [Nocardia sp.]
PVVVLLLALGPLLLPEHRASALAPLDLPSAALLVGGILPVVYAIKRSAASGPDIQALIALLLGIAVGALFVRRQRRLPEPLVDFALFTRARFAVAIGSSTTVMMSLAGASYLTSVWLQSVTGRSPLAAAFLGIPMAITVFTFSMTGSALARRLGLRWTFALGLAVAAAGNLLLLGIGVDGGVGWYLAGSAIAGIGYGTVFTLVSEVAVASVPEHRAGSAVGISETSFELGNALGLALLGSLAALRFRSAGHFGPTIGETTGDRAVVAAARAAYVCGAHLAITTGAGILLVAAVVAVVVGGGRSRA